MFDFFYFGIEGSFSPFADSFPRLKAPFVLRQDFSPILSSVLPIRPNMRIRRSWESLVIPERSGFLSPNPPADQGPVIDLLGSPLSTPWKNKIVDFCHLSSNERHPAVFPKEVLLPPFGPEPWLSSIQRCRRRWSFAVSQGVRSTYNSCAPSLS